MRFRRYSTDAFELYEIHPLFAELLADLPHAAARHNMAEQRIYPDPFGPEEEDEARSDWEEHVRPELIKHFAASRHAVACDLSSLGDGRQGGRCVIPAKHLDAWLNALNQARLVIVEENEFGEADLSVGEPPDLETRKGLSLLKMHFYGHLQELLVEVAG